MIHAWSTVFARHIVNELNFDEKRFRIIAYGLEIIIGALIKLVAFVCMALALGIPHQFAAAFFSIAFLKLPSGGAHCSTYCRCLISSLIVFSVIGYTAKSFATTALPYREILWGVLAVAFWVFFKLAPVDVEQKPIRSEIRRRNLKIVSLVVLTAYFLASMFWNPGNDIILACSMGVLFHTFTLTPAGFIFFRWIDKVIPPGGKSFGV